MVQEVLGENKIEYVIVRDPVQRFLSGFVDKCVNEGTNQSCFGCVRDMGCFLEKLHSLIWKVQKHDDDGHSFELIHFSPQTWFCNFKEHLHKYNILRYVDDKNRVNKFTEGLLSIFRKAGVPKDIRDEIREELLIGKTVHTTAGSDDRMKAEKTLLSNSTLLTLLSRIYYYDFVVFDFKLPVII
ncbi:hypothetical protein RB195_014534 [Necator americanus]